MCAVNTGRAFYWQSYFSTDKRFHDAEMKRDSDFRGSNVRVFM